MKDAAGWEYDPKAMEFEHAKLLHSRNRQKRSSTSDLSVDIVVSLDNFFFFFVSRKVNMCSLGFGRTFLK